MTQRKSVALQAVAQVSRYIRVPHLDSIKSRILALAVIGTLVPAGITLGVAYTQNRRALQDKISQDLLSESSQTAGAIRLWLKDRLYDMKVYAGSEEVSTNVSRYATAGLASPRLREYLRSLHDRVPDFEQLLVLDGNGRVIATSAAQIDPVQLPADWQKTLRQEGQVVADAYWDDKAGKGKLIVAVPVIRADGQLIGSFAAELNLAPVQKLLASGARDTLNGIVYLASDSATVIASSREISKRLLSAKINPGTFKKLLARPNSSMTYASFSGMEVLGSARPVPEFPHWVVGAEMSSDSAFEQLRSFRNSAVLVMIVVLLLVAATAYRLGLIIVRPLERLAEGAADVAMGALDVDLPVTTTAGEVGALTKIFNDMVLRLRLGRAQLALSNEQLQSKNEELERLSVTDGLTGLTNHRALMQRLNEETMRSQRNKKALTVIMADVDHFKKYNDEFGHPEGDVVLKQVAAILKEATRTVDCVARYGGEEFSVLLPETEMSGAVEVAERIRSRVEGAEFPGRRITLSIGVAEFPKDADTAPEIIAAADAALYVAKREGRNQVARAIKSTKKRDLPSAKAGRKSVVVKKKS